MDCVSQQQFTLDRWQKEARTKFCTTFSQCYRKTINPTITATTFVNGDRVETDLRDLPPIPALRVKGKEVRLVDSFLFHTDVYPYIEKYLEDFHGHAEPILEALEEHPLSYLECFDCEDGLDRRLAFQFMAIGHTLGEWNMVLPEVGGMGNFFSNAARAFVYRGGIFLTDKRESVVDITDYHAMISRLSPSAFHADLLAA